MSHKTFIDPIDANGTVKYTVGKLTNIECRKLDIGHIWVRLVSEYGPNDHEDRLIKQFIKHCKENIPMNLSECSHIWDFLYEDDVGEALFLLGVKGINDKIYILGSGTGRPLKDYLEIIRNKVNKNYKPNYGAVLYTKNSILYLVADISELYKDTGWQPRTTFEAGIDKVIRGVV